MIIYHISLGLVEFNHLFVMYLIYMILKTFSAGLVIEVSALIIRVFNREKIENPCCINLEDSVPDLITEGSESNIM